MCSAIQGLGASFAHCHRKRNLALQMDLRTRLRNHYCMSFSSVSFLKLQTRIFCLTKKLDGYSEIQISNNSKLHSLTLNEFKQL